MLDRKYNGRDDNLDLLKGNADPILRYHVRAVIQEAVNFVEKYSNH